LVKQRHHSSKVSKNTHNLDKLTGVRYLFWGPENSMSMGNIKVLIRELNWLKRKMKEATYITKPNDPPRPESYHIAPECNKDSQLTGRNQSK